MPRTVSQPHGSYLTQSLEHASVSDAMHPGILSCDPDATVTQVAKIMATHHVHCVAVIGISHQAPECFVWGIVSDIDLVRAGIGDGAAQTARELAGQPIVVVEPTTALTDAAREMLDRDVSHAVVVDPDAGRPIGVLSTLDVAGVLAWGEA